jgi:hypothetical protein
MTQNTTKNLFCFKWHRFIIIQFEKLNEQIFDPMEHKILFIVVMHLIVDWVQEQV